MKTKSMGFDDRGFIASVIIGSNTSNVGKFRLYLGKSEEEQLSRWIKERNFEYDDKFVYSEDFCMTAPFIRSLLLAKDNILELSEIISDAVCTTQIRWLDSEKASPFTILFSNFLTFLGDEYSNNFLKKTSHLLGQWEKDSVGIFMPVDGLNPRCPSGVNKFDTSHRAYWGYLWEYWEEVFKDKEFYEGFVRQLELSEKAWGNMKGAVEHEDNSTNSNSFTSEYSSIMIVPIIKSEGKKYLLRFVDESGRYVLPLVGNSLQVANAIKSFTNELTSYQLTESVLDSLGPKRIPILLQSVEIEIPIKEIFNFLNPVEALRRIFGFSVLEIPEEIEDVQKLLGANYSTNFKPLLVRFFEKFYSNIESN